MNNKRLPLKSNYMSCKHLTTALFKPSKLCYKYLFTTTKGPYNFNNVLNVSAINEYIILPETYDLTPIPLDGQKYERITKWRMVQ